MSDLAVVEEQIREYLASPEASKDGLLSEHTIASKFSLNRSNSRKLLMSLEGQGLLECLPQKGYRRVDYSNTTNRTFYAVRSAIEAEAARLACERATREDILRMMLIMEEAEEAVKRADFKRFPYLDRDFHRALIAASHDKLLKKLHTLLYIPAVFKQPWQNDDLIQTHQHHLDILDAIRKQDPVAAVAAIKEHIGKMCNDEIFKENPNR